MPVGKGLCRVKGFTKLEGKLRLIHNSSVSRGISQTPSLTPFPGLSELACHIC